MSSVIRHRSPPIPVRPSAEARGPVTVEEAQAMLRAVLNLFDKWEIAKPDRLILLGGVSDRTMHRWRTGDIGPLSNDTVYRLANLLGIHKALRFMFEGERAYHWVKRPNDAFGGTSALDLMRQGAPSDISRVRRYLDAERGAW